MHWIHKKISYLSLFLYFCLSSIHHHLLLLHPLTMCAHCLVMKVPVILGRSASTMTQSLINVLNSGMEAAMEMPITLSPWKHARDNVGVW